MSRKSLYFNGTNAYLQSWSNFMPSTNIYTVEFYMKATSTTQAYRRIFTNNYVQADGNALIFRESGIGSLQLYIGTTNYDAPTNLDFKNKWVKITLVADGSRTKVYMDKEKIIDAGACISFLPQWAIWLGGYYRNGSSYTEWFQGYITEITALSYAKSEEEIKSDNYYYTDKLNSKVHTYYNTEKQSTFWNNKQLEIFNATWSDDVPIMRHGLKSLLKSNDKIYSLQPIVTEHETKMTSNTTPAPFVASASSVYSTTFPAWKAFNGTNTLGANDYWASLSVDNNAYLQMDYGKQYVFNTLIIEAINHTSGASASPKKFEIKASVDGLIWDSLLSVTEDNSWKTGEKRQYYFYNKEKYRYYRVSFLESFSSSPTHFNIANIIFGYESHLTQLPSDSVDNFIEYGSTSIENFNLINGSKNYILQDTVSENADGLWVQELDRKPLSIKFE